MSNKKLRGLLATSNPLTPKPLNNPLPIKKAQSPCLSPTIVPTSQKTTAIIKPHNIPLYYEVPGVQGFFYSPFVKSEAGEQNTMPSPWLEPFKIGSLKDLPPLSHASAHTAADSRGDQTGNHSPDNDCSNSLCSLIKKLTTKFPSQPKNLEELLQRSFTSMPSYSMLKSPFHSALPSPFPQSHTSFMFQGLRPGSANEISMRGNSLQKSFLVGAQALKPQINVGTDQDVINQIADLISKDEDHKVMSKIYDLVSQFGNPEGLKQENNHEGGLGLIPKEKLKRNRDGQFLPNINDTASNRNNTNFALSGIGSINNTGPGETLRPKQIPLSNGLHMNAVERSPKTSSYVPVNPDYKNPCLHNPKVEAARKELFVISEKSEQKSESKPKRSPSNDFNLFNYTGAPIEFPTPNKNNNSPLISSASISKDKLNLNLLSQPYNMTSHSNSHQAASLSTNSSHSDKGISLNKKFAFEITGKSIVSSTFRLVDDTPIPSKMLDTSEAWNKNLNLKEKMTNKPINKGKSTRQAGKKARGKGKKVTVEQYVQHVITNNREDSNLTIEETWEEDDSWADEK